jgi:signal transduction histidine kinase
MARRLTTLSRRLLLVVLSIHAVLLPVLFFAISTVVHQNMTDAFVDDSRVQGRIVADNLELDPDARLDLLEEQLDSAILGGRIVHASLKRGDTEIASSLMSDEDLALFNEDFEFGEHGDDIYYLSLPIAAGNTMAILRLGFDESHTQSNFDGVRQSIVIVITAYLFITIVAAFFLSSTLTQSLSWLQRASRSIASGDYHKQLQTDSSLVEINDLTQDLERMRSNLVKVNARLRHAQRLESLGTLAGGVAHEFNNVLQPLLLYTDLALEDLPDDSPIASNMERVLELANRAKGLSQQILTFGHVGDEGEFEKLPIAPVVEEAITMIRALLPATVDLRVGIDAGVGRVRCDPAQIQQLVVNLCNNAFQALTTGDAHIGISLSGQLVAPDLAARHPHLEAREYAVLRVSDTGRGMDAETIERVFEPFFTTQEVGEGTGLGLSVVHGIVRRHDGEILLTSEIGKGTQFRIFLPLAGNNEHDQR